MTFKRIVAIIGIAILVILYIVTLISAIFTTPATPELFKACVYATVIVPVLFYAYLLIYKVLKQRSEDSKKEMDEALAKNGNSSESNEHKQAKTSISERANMLSSNPSDEDDA